MQDRTPGASLDKVSAEQILTAAYTPTPRSTHRVGSMSRIIRLEVHVKSRPHCPRIHGGRKGSYRRGRTSRVPWQPGGQMASAVLTEDGQLIGCCA